MSIARNETILTIAIPTWNRAELLHEILTELCNDISTFDLASKVEIFISNNGSEDNTEEVCLEFKSKYKFISYNNNGINIGAKNNVLICFQKSSGKYIILLGDDDRINLGSIKAVIDTINSNKEIDLILDTAAIKKQPFPDGSVLNIKQFVEYFYYYIGNAGLFIYKNQLGKNVLNSHSFDYFNKCWPQTQLMLLGLHNINSSKCLIKQININAPGLHNEVMVYTSYYLYRTTYFDLLDSIISVKQEIDYEIYIAARKYLNNNSLQVIYNILQCGIFVDDKITINQTRNHILQNFSILNVKEKLYLSIVVLTFSLPKFITIPFANLFIILVKGKAGLIKKNKFVLTEKSKMQKKQLSLSKVIREFNFN